MVLTLIGFVGFVLGLYFAAPERRILIQNTGGMIFQALLVVFTALSGLLFFFSSRIKMGFNRLMRSIRERRGQTVPDLEDTGDEFDQESDPRRKRCNFIIFTCC